MNTPTPPKWRSIVINDVTGFVVLDTEKWRTDWRACLADTPM